MNLIIEMTDGIGMDYYYVTLYCEGNHLVIETPHRMAKVLRRQLPINELEQVHWEVNGQIKRLIFTYQAESYSIIDVGDGFEEQIAAKVFQQTLV